MTDSPADRAAVYAEVADRLAADAEQGDKDGLTRIYRRSAATQVRGWADELAAVSVPAPAPTDETALRDRIAETLWPLTDWDGDRCNAEAAADAVLAVLPTPTDRVALLALIDRLIEHCPDHGCVEPAWEDGCHCEIVPLLRRLAAASGSGRVADETQARCEKCSPAAGETEPNNPVDWAEIDRRTAQSGVDTPGCDCGHDGMGASWHSKDCEWRSVPPCDHCGVRGHSFEDCPRDEQPAVVSQPDGEA